MSSIPKAATSQCKQPDPNDKQAVPCLPCKLSHSDNPAHPPPHPRACYANTLKHMRVPTANDSVVYTWCQPYNCSVIEFIPLQGSKRKTNNKSTKPLPSEAPPALLEVSGGWGWAQGQRYANVSRHVGSQSLYASRKRSVSHLLFSPQSPDEGLDGCVARDSQRFTRLQISAWVLQILREKSC